MFYFYFLFFLRIIFFILTYPVLWFCCIIDIFAYILFRKFGKGNGLTDRFSNWCIRIHSKILRKQSKITLDGIK